MNSIRVCAVDDCGQAVKPNHGRCWHHWLIAARLGYGALPTMHGLLRELCDENEEAQERDGRRGCYFLSEVSHVAPRRAADEALEVFDPECLHPWGDPTYWELDEALAHIPDALDACYWGPLSGCGDDHNYHLYANAERSQELIALVWFDWSDAEENEET